MGLSSRLIPTKAMSRRSQVRLNCQPSCCSQPVPARQPGQALRRIHFSGQMCA